MDCLALHLPTLAPSHLPAFAADLGIVQVASEGGDPQTTQKDAEPGGAGLGRFQFAGSFPAGGRGWDVSSQKVLGREAGQWRRDVAAPREGGYDRG